MTEKRIYELFPTSSIIERGEIDRPIKKGCSSRFLRRAFLFRWRPFLFRGDVNGLGFVQALLEIAYAKPNPPTDLGNFSSSEEEENDAENDDQLPKP